MPSRSLSLGRGSEATLKGRGHVPPPGRHQSHHTLGTGPAGATRLLLHSMTAPTTFSQAHDVLESLRDASPHASQKNAHAARGPRALCVGVRLPSRRANTAGGGLVCFSLCSACVQ